MLNIYSIICTCLCFTYLRTNKKKIETLTITVRYDNKSYQTFLKNVLNLPKGIPLHKYAKTLNLIYYHLVTELNP